METEYIKSMHSNYARILLEEMPDEGKYQYCILSRGGIRGLLPCSLRKIDDACYMYYDITSRQNITQMFRKKRIDRNWVKDFLWSLKEIQMELDRFLLNDNNILWFPEFVYQDLENHIFLFMYMPYYNGENGFMKLMDFILENLDYDDEELVECAYKMYGQYEDYGEIYLQGHIFEDIKSLDKKREEPLEEEIQNEDSDIVKEEPLQDSWQELRPAEKGKRKLFSLFEKKTQAKEENDRYRQALKLQMDGRAVAEETGYGEEYGRTFFVERPQEEAPVKRLCTQDEKIVAVLKEDCVTLGKYEEEVDVVVKDPSVSRIHARITKENGKYFIEDMNSTNGTSKNGIRLKPYEKKILNEEDEIVMGKMTLIFR